MNIARTRNIARRRGIDTAITCRPGRLTTARGLLCCHRAVPGLRPGMSVPRRRPCAGLIPLLTAGLGPRIPPPASLRIATIVLRQPTLPERALDGHPSTIRRGLETLRPRTRRTTTRTIAGLQTPPNASLYQPAMTVLRLHRVPRRGRHLRRARSAVRRRTIQRATPIETSGPLPRRSHRVHPRRRTSPRHPRRFPHANR